mmetsp:Transcript_30780/g.59402  ORF Transcript_30780/g.59402 Transcript_30780/m.59402 type:complete len:224 (-) Transcript_30780:1864-2535(-)
MCRGVISAPSSLSGSSCVSQGRARVLPRRRERMATHTCSHSFSATNSSTVCTVTSEGSPAGCRHAPMSDTRASCHKGSGSPSFSIGCSSTCSSSRAGSLSTCSCSAASPGCSGASSSKTHTALSSAVARGSPITSTGSTRRRADIGTSISSSKRSSITRGPTRASRRRRQRPWRPTRGSQDCLDTSTFHVCTRPVNSASSGMGPSTTTSTVTMSFLGAVQQVV